MPDSQIHSPNERLVAEYVPLGIATARELFRERLPLARQIVAEGRDHGPDAISPSKVAIDQHTGADAARRLDHRRQVGMNRELSREVVIEIFDANAAFEQRGERRPVDGHRDIKCGDRIAGARRDTLQQRNITLDAAYEDRIRWRREPQLM